MVRRGEVWESGGGEGGQRCVEVVKEFMFNVWYLYLMLVEKVSFGVLYVIRKHWKDRHF